MLPKSLIRAKVSALYPTLDKYTLSRCVDRIHEFAYSESDLAEYRIRGAVECRLRHERTDYEEQLRALSAPYYSGARKQFQEAARHTLQLKYGV